MEHSEPAISVTIYEQKPYLGFQSPKSSPECDPIPTPPPSFRTRNDAEKLDEELQKLLVLKEEDKDSKFSNEDGSFKSVEGGEEDIGNEDGSENEQVGDEVEKKNEIRNGNKWHHYPLRPDAEDCTFYLKTGTCKFGSSCKFNHPVRRKKQASEEKVKERDEATARPGKIECKYYLKTGGCKYGKACRYNHSRETNPVLPVSELNFLGLPIRLGEKECAYYMRNGSCKYGTQCMFNHPDPMAVGGSDPHSEFGNGGSAALQGSSISSVASWSSATALNETVPYMPIMFPPTQGVPSQSPEWNGYQAPVYLLEGSLHPPPAYLISDPMNETNVYGHQQQQMLIDEFPERPGQRECSYFLKTGDCKFKSNCKFHHPKDRSTKALPCLLNEKGLPLRPDQNICSYYSRYGICKFGPGCKFNHPETLPSSMGSGDGQIASLASSAAKEDAGTVASENGSDIAIQQPV